MAYNMELDYAKIPETQHHHSNRIMLVIDMYLRACRQQDFNEL